MLLGPRIGKYKKDGTVRAIPGHNIAYVVIGTLVLVFGWMGFNPGSTFGATDLRIGIVAVNTLLAACAGASWRWAGPTRSTASPTSRCRATACSPGSSPSPRPAPSSRRGRRGDRRHRRRARVLQRRVLRPEGPGRRPVRRDLGARHVRRVGRARGRALRRRHLRHRLERCLRQRCTACRALLRRRRTARRADLPRGRRLRLGVGVMWLIFRSPSAS